MNIAVDFMDVVIRYNEQNNRWEYELRGRERWSESLALAKEAIVKPAPKDKPAFTPIEAYYVDRWGDDEMQKCEVTSVAEGSRYSRNKEFWISIDKTRRKEDADKIVERTPGNIKKHKDARALKAKAAQLEKQAKELLDAMTRVPVPADEEDTSTPK